MRSVRCLALGALLLPGLALARNTTEKEKAAPPAAGAARNEAVFGNPIQYKNLTLIPVGTNRSGPFQKYTLLEAGLEAKTIQVRELAGSSGDAQVNTVEVKNRGNYPVYLLGGEMILGGKQDRIIQHDAVVPSTQKWTKVSVFCVEHGRWQGQNMKFAAGKAMAHAALREAALSGSQSKVWDAVAVKNKQQGSESSTGTYRRTIQNDKVRKQIAPYRDEIVKLLPKEMKMAGMVFAINGKIRVADLFNNPVLFGDVRDKLLSAYLLEALGQRVDPHARPLSSKAAKGFFDEVRKGKGMKMKGASGRSINYKKDLPNAIGSDTIDAETGEKVRESYIGKQK
jgi:hypothetical protein